jgi:predicted nucleic acid-binding protein
VSVFVDTSALYALLATSDRFHRRARQTWTRLLDGEDDLVTTNYVLVETLSLAQGRLGMEAVRALEEDVVPALRIRWVDGETHALAVAALLAAGRRRLSLVDCASFAAMQESGIRRAFAFDRHFREQGVELVG